jgi:hypothetical protein
MKLSMSVSNTGISLSLGDSRQERLQGSPNADQVAPRRSYVYGHFTERNVPFYIGKGTGRRAWSDDRHPMWSRYVTNHLSGRYSVVVLQDDLSPEQAEQLENAWIAQESETLVNWINMSRRLDFAALDKYTHLRNTTLQLVASAKSLEKSQAGEAIELYYRAIEQLPEYAGIQFELGLVGQLIDEEVKENGLRGELQILDRLTLCLVRADRRLEAQQVASRYFATYVADARLSAAARIRKRLGVGSPNDG